MYAGPEDVRAPTIQQTLVRRDDGALPEHAVSQLRQALDCRFTRHHILQAAAVRARIAGGAVVLKGLPLGGAEARREVAGRGWGLVRADGHFLGVRR